MLPIFLLILLHALTLSAQSLPDSQKQLLNCFGSERGDGPPCSTKPLVALFHLNLLLLLLAGLDRRNRLMRVSR